MEFFPCGVSGVAGSEYGASCLPYARLSLIKRWDAANVAAGIRAGAKKGVTGVRESGGRERSES